MQEARMTEQTDRLGWTIPTPNDPSEAGKWARILNTAINENIEPDVAAALHSSGGSQLKEARETANPEQGPLAAYMQIGQGQLSQLRHTQHIVGSRHMAAHWPLVDSHFRDDKFTYTNSAAEERIQLIGYSFLDQPPNMVPVLRAQVQIKSTGTGTFGVGIRHKSHPKGDYIMTFETSGNPDTLYGETYLHQVPNGSAARGPATLEDTAFEVYAGIADGGGTGEIYGGSQLMLDWEVV